MGRPLLAANDEAHYATLHANLGSNRVPKGAAKEEAMALTRLLSDDPNERASASVLQGELKWLQSAVTSQKESGLVSLEDFERASTAEDVRKMLETEASQVA